MSTIFFDFFRPPCPGVFFPSFPMLTEYPADAGRGHPRNGRKDCFGHVRGTYACGFPWQSRADQWTIRERRKDPCHEKASHIVPADCIRLISDEENGFAFDASVSSWDVMCPVPLQGTGTGMRIRPPFGEQRNVFSHVRHKERNNRNKKNADMRRCGRSRRRKTAERKSTNKKSGSKLSSP